MAATTQNVLDFLNLRDNRKKDATGPMLARVQAWLEESRGPFYDDQVPPQERPANADDFIEDIWERYRQQVRAKSKSDHVPVDLNDTV